MGKLQKLSPFFTSAKHKTIAMGVFLDNVWVRCPVYQALGRVAFGWVGPGVYIPRGPRNRYSCWRLPLSCLMGIRDAPSHGPLLITEILETESNPTWGWRGVDGWNTWNIHSAVGCFSYSSNKKLHWNTTKVESAALSAAIGGFPSHSSAWRSLAESWDRETSISKSPVRSYYQRLFRKLLPVDPSD